ncbi:hypothetical protein pipiens_016207 [Culex pipiens pipiens]|uniref:Putative inositol monophosphatase 3 n=1 Tax=Culex pipiens pipiens TaxID=38569 RepID=A0ABD1CME5_CULPP
MCNQDHSIESVSVADNEKFTYPVILIKGSLGNRCETGELKVQIDNHDCPVSKDVRFINEKRGQFKVLLRLKEGENRVTLTYCSRELELNLFFEESENPHRITPLYIICDGHDGCFQSDTAENSIENACAKITLGIQLVQSLYAEKMAEKWSSRKTFTIAGDCLPFRSSLPLQESKAMTDQQLWNFFAKEILQSELYTSEKQKFIGFISSTYYEGISDNDFSYENIKRRTTGNVALGGGGLALFGTGCLYTWPDRLDGIVPAFLNTTLVNRELMMDDSNYRYTYGGCFATTIGSVCHEMGHIFDLGHTKDGIMGSGLDHVNRVFTLITNTEDLPDRVIGRGGPTRKSLNSKLTQIKRPGEFLLKYQQQKESDVTYFADNCAVTLRFHKWFNYSPSSNDNNCDTRISFNFVTRIVTSVNSFLKLIELRDRVDGMLKVYWSFLETDTDNFQVVDTIQLDGLTLFVIDSYVNLRKLLIGSIQAAQRGGLEVVEVSKSIDLKVQSKGKTKEGANDPVTDADFRSHCVMADGLHRIFPKLRIISEEDSAKQSCPDAKLFDLDPTVMHETNVLDEIVDIDEVTVWIDPLDATQEYTESLTEYVTTMTTVWAWVNKAMSEPLSNMKRDEEVKNPVLIVSRSHTGDVQTIAKEVFGKNVHIIKAGGAGYKVLKVLNNEATAYLHSTAIKKWDICAGNAILNAVGGKMTDLNNQEISYSDKDPFVNEKGLLATASSSTHEQYIKKILEKNLL